MHRDRNLPLTTVALGFFVFLYAPIAILILFSFNDSKRNFLWRGFTLKWYPTLFANDALIQALVVSLEVAVIAVVVSTFLGTLLGLGIARLRSSVAGGTSDTLLLLPMVTPEIVMGISLLLFFAINKQAFANYYYAVIGALCCAAAADGAEKENARMEAGVESRGKLWKLVESQRRISSLYFCSFSLSFLSISVTLASFTPRQAAKSPVVAAWAPPSCLV